MDNLFSSPDLFRNLRHKGHGATCTARLNCGFYKPLVHLRVDYKSGKNMLKFNEVQAIPTADDQYLRGT
ncbi:hypothetical protein FOPG_18382 [Fusarium oxysporum f. sp. conglutinans race 2 54008]|uniref:PiggyBac transposable element-derived protein domain-containing protein n=1 Tax=Fusarium oxysporum f. sp. conglutinans race 2 54008 TaxID=1089457 RepID=X0GZZ5_FUSOX|nr:hypothetical protein FOPG_18382 [Fusarium oxysporum f. sp. conglutinans race 2 54008]